MDIYIFLSSVNCILSDEDLAAPCSCYRDSDHTTGCIGTYTSVTVRDCCISAAATTTTTFQVHGTEFCQDCPLSKFIHAMPILSSRTIYNHSIFGTDSYVCHLGDGCTHNSNTSITVTSYSFDGESVCCQNDSFSSWQTKESATCQRCLTAPGITS